MSGGDSMLDNYDFSNAKTNPYAKKLKKQVTMRIDVETIAYFKSLSEKTGVPYQSLMNMELADCAMNKRQPIFSWQ